MIRLIPPILKDETNWRLCALAAIAAFPLGIVLNSRFGNVEGFGGIGAALILLTFFGGTTVVSGILISASVKRLADPAQRLQAQRIVCVIVVTWLTGALGWAVVSVRR